MNLHSLLGCSTSTFVDEQAGGPPQRILNAYHALLNAINIANLYSNVGNNAARAARLNALKPAWESKAAMIWSKSTATASPYSEASQFSLDLANEISTALAYNDDAP